MYPLLMALSVAFRSQKDLLDPSVIWIPKHFTLENVQWALDNLEYFPSLWNTVKLSLVSSLLQIASCAVVAYGFARFKFKGKKLFFALVIFTIIVPEQVIYIPKYLMYKDMFLLNNPLCMYLPALLGVGIRSGLFIYIFNQFYRNLPKELEDAAYLDGCGPLRTFAQIMVPNARSSFLTVFLFSVVWYWNDYYVSSSFFTNNETIAMMVKNLNTQLNLFLFNDATVQVSVREKIVWLEAGCLLSITPILIMYVFLQKYFTEGIERSGLVA